MSAFSDTIAAAHAATRAAAGITVTLQRDDATTENVPAVPGRSAYTSEDVEGSRVRVQRRDFLVQADEYLIDGQAVEPQAGDLLIEILGERSTTFEVAPLTANTDPWAWRDSGETLYRIHARRIV